MHVKRYLLPGSIVDIHEAKWHNYLDVIMYLHYILQTECCFVCALWCIRVILTFIIILRVSLK